MGEGAPAEGFTTCGNVEAGEGSVFSCPRPLDGLPACSAASDLSAAFSFADSHNPPVQTPNCGPVGRCGNILHVTGESRVIQCVCNVSYPHLEGMKTPIAWVLRRKSHSEVSDEDAVVAG